MNEKSKIGTESYKGVRDFYPEDMFVQNYIFGVWREVAKSFGYVEYGASILEPAELYRAKSGEEIVGEQTYTFKDRGDREVTLRPEMTPTVARMIAGREHDLPFPARWYSIQNLFRYEKPQRGRLREHWQLNVDLFGLESIESDCEVISVAYHVMKKFGAKDENFVIKINSRKLLDDLYKYFSLLEEQSQKLAKLMDKKNKIPPEVFEAGLSEVVGDKTQDIIRIISSSERFMDTVGKNNPNAEDIVKLIEKLQKDGIKNVIFEPTLMRGFDYYTGVVFEVYDTHPENNRSIFGGGRYDNLLDIFGATKIPTVGFGAGDVTARDFLEVHNLLPDYTATTELYIAVLDEKYFADAKVLAENLRKENIKVAIDFSGRKIGDQIKTADKQKIPFTLVIGENEIKTKLYPLKNLSTGEEKKVDVSGIVELIKKSGNA